MKYMNASIVIMAAASMAAPAYAQSPLQLSSTVYVERVQTLEDGSSKAVLEKPTTVIPGDSLIFIVKYQNISAKPASNLLITNPLPKPVQFDGTADGNEQVSVDGGKNYGPINTLFIKKNDGTSRAAEMRDVTHIRWNLRETLAPEASGKVIFRGIVK